MDLIWLVDCSGSMDADGRIQSLNNAIREAIAHLQQFERQNPQIAMYVRAISFSEGARWLHPESVRVADYRWTDLKAKGETDMGQAFSMVADQLQDSSSRADAWPPVLILVSDGFPTDDYLTGLSKLLAQPWGEKALRLAIAIGSDADREVLRRFIDDLQIQPFHARSPEELSFAVQALIAKVTG